MNKPSSKFVHSGPISNVSIKKNAKGGIAVDKNELKHAFDFFDTKQKGVITQQDLKARLSVFYKNLQPREYKFLMNNQPELTFEQLYGLLAENELSNFDPVAEAFKIYDPTETGYANVEILSDIFSHLGFGKLSDEDLKILVETADMDRDGKVSLEDFRRMLDDPIRAMPQHAQDKQELQAITEK